MCAQSSYTELMSYIARGGDFHIIGKGLGKCDSYQCHNIQENCKRSLLIFQENYRTTDEIPNEVIILKTQKQKYEVLTILSICIQKSLFQGNF